MTKNIRKKLMMAMVAGALSVSMVMSVAASTPCSNCVPSSELSLNSSVAKVAAHRAAETAPLMLGAELTTMQTNATASNIANSEVFNIFASKCNANPAVLLNNYYYNLVTGNAVSNNLIKLTTTVAPTMADSNSANSNSDIFLGNAANGSGYTYPSTLDSIPYACSNLEDMIGTMYNLATEMNSVKGTTSSGRYGNPVVIANDYERYIKGTKYYVLDQLQARLNTLNASSTKQKTLDDMMAKVAVITRNSEGTYKLYTDDASAGGSGTAATCRGAEYLAGTTHNVYQDVADPTSATISEIVGEGVEYIFLVGVQGSSLTQAIVEQDYLAENTDEEEFPDDIVFVTNLPKTTYGIVMNSVENAIGVGIFLSIVYNDILDMEEAAAYFYNDFYHLNICCMDSKLDTNFEDLSDWYDSTKYTKATISDAVSSYAAMLNSGMASRSTWSDVIAVSSSFNSDYVSYNPTTSTCSSCSDCQ